MKQTWDSVNITEVSRPRVCVGKGREKEELKPFNHLNMSLPNFKNKKEVNSEDYITDQNTLGNDDMPALLFCYYEKL